MKDCCFDCIKRALRSLASGREFARSPTKKVESVAMSANAVGCKKASGKKVEEEGRERVASDPCRCRNSDRGQQQRSRLTGQEAGRSTTKSRAIHHLNLPTFIFFSNLFTSQFDADREEELILIPNKSMERAATKPLQERRTRSEKHRTCAQSTQFDPILIWSSQFFGRKFLESASGAQISTTTTRPILATSLF